MVASCWFFLWDLYYDAQIHEHQVKPYSVELVSCPKFELGTSRILATSIKA